MRTNNGAGFALDDDAAAIDWLQRNIEGTPLILEAHRPSYQWAGRIATYTGLPTLLGWEWHQIQQRNVVGAGPIISARQRAIEEIYQAADPVAALELLQRYGIEYVYVGGFERNVYAAEGLAQLEQLAQRGFLETVFSQGRATIYRVTNPGEPTVLTDDRLLLPPQMDTPPPLLLNEPVNELPAVREYGWNQLTGASSWPALLTWLIAMYGLTGLGLPLAWMIFGGWRDGGFGWARLIGWLLLGYAVWLPTSLGLWHYNRWALLGGLLVLLLMNTVLLGWRGRQAGAVAPLAAVRRGLQLLGATLRERRRAILAVEGVFLTGFLGLGLIRALNPDLWHPVWGGEKPMEFGFLNAILRSPVMPPYDPFFSDGYINYYYYGLYLVSLPIKALGIDPAIGFNLAVAAVFGLLLSGAFVLVTQLAGRMRYGLIGAALVGVAGNPAALFGGGWSRGYGVVLRSLGEGLSGFGARLGDWYVGPSRVIPNTINEFPFFTFLFADLHPHMIALPITLLAIGLGYRWMGGGSPASTANGASGSDSPGRPDLHRWPVAALLALTIGTLAVTNSWDVPTYGLLTGLVLLGSTWRAVGTRGSGIPWAALLRHGLLAVLIGVVGLASYAPFFDRFYALVGGIGTVALDGGSSVGDFLAMYGLLVLPALLLVMAGLAHVLSRERKATTNVLVLPILFVGITLVLAALVPQLALRVTLLLLLIGTSLLLLQRRIAMPTWFTLLLFWMAWAVALGFETLFIRDHLAGGDWQRMNTVFKFGLQVWVLLALGVSASLPRLLAGLQRMGGPPARMVGMVGLVLVGIVAAAYPLAAVPSRIANRFDVQTGPTLDGLAFMEQAGFSYDCNAWGGCTNGLDRVEIDLRGDAAAIEWLNREIQGTPIVVQSNLSFYRSYGIRIAANTGLPTVISALHANEQRDSFQTAARDRDLEQFYSTPSVEAALRFLARYRVNYVYVGGVEHAVYPRAGLAKFDTMRDSYLSPVYETPTVQIYQVLNIPQQYAQPAPYDFSADEPVADPEPLPPGAQPAGLSELEQAVAESPTNAPLVFGLAEAYRSVGRFDDAARVLEVAALANPEDIGLHHLWGDILVDAGRYDEAERAYLLAAQADPTAGNWNKLGAALLDWGELDKAEIALQQALSVDPDWAEPYFHLGRLFALRGDVDQARANLRRYLERDPQGPWALDAGRILADLEME
jgi:YYY domain-containing protein